MVKTKSTKSPPVLSDSRFRMKDWHAVVGLCVLIAIFFRDILLQRAFLWEDFLYFYYPARNFAAVSLASGEIPLWNPYMFNGMPFQADIQTAFFYLPNLLLTLFVSGGKLSCYWLELEIIAHYMIAAVSMYFLARSFELHRLFAVFSALVFALSGFLITHAIHQTLICEIVWLPLLVLMFRSTLLKKSVFSMIISGILLGQMILAGYPQLTLYVCLLLLVLFLFEFFQSSKQKGWKPSLPLAPLALGVIVLALAVSAIQLLPTFELAAHSLRAEITYQKSLDNAMPWSGLLTLIAPKLFGESGAQGATFWGEGIYGQYWETSIYVGMTTLVLVAFALTTLKQNRVVALLSGLALFGLLYALGDSFVLHKFFFHVVPGFNKFRGVARFAFLSTFSLALLAGFGLQRLFELIESNTKLVQRILFIFSGIVVIFWFAVSQGAFQPTSNPRVYQQVHPIALEAATTSLILVLIVCGIMFLGTRKMVSFFFMVVLLIATQYIDSSLFGFNQNNAPVNPDEYFGRTADIVRMLKEEGKQELFRINSRAGGAMLLDRNQGMIDRIFSMEGYSSLVLQRINAPAKDWSRVCDMMNAKYHIVVNEQQRSMSIGTSSTYLPRTYIVHHAKLIRDEAEQRAFMSSDAFDPHNMVVLENDPPFSSVDTSSGNDGKATVTAYNLNSIKVDASSGANGYLCFSEVYYPGWNAYVDGKEAPVYRANWNLRAVPIEAGNHHVEMVFEPKSFSRGLWITLITLGVSVVGLLVTKKTMLNKSQEGAIA